MALAARGWQTARDQSRNRILRRRAWHLVRHQPARDGIDQGQLHLHQRRAHRRRRCLVGGDDQRSARASDRLDRPGLDAGLRPRRRTCERPFHRPGRAMPVDRCKLAKPRWCADRRRCIWRTPCNYDASSISSLQLEPRRVPRRDDGIGNDRRRLWSDRQSPPRPDGDAAVLRLQHGRLLRPLARDAPLSHPPAALFPCELVPQR